MMDGMAGKKPETGATASTVAANVRRLRTAQNLSYTQLSDRLVDWSISPVAIRRVEDEERRVDVDDLVALAVALDVSPLTLLTPVADTPEQIVSATSQADVAAVDLWMWMRTELPVRKTAADVMENLEFQWRAKPSWQLPEIADRVQMTTEAVRRMADEHDRRTLANRRPEPIADRTPRDETNGDD